MASNKLQHKIKQLKQTYKQLKSTKGNLLHHQPTDRRVWARELLEAKFSQGN